VYLSGVVGLIVVMLAVLIMVGVLGLSNIVVGGMFLALAIGNFGPWIDRRAA